MANFILVVDRNSDRRAQFIKTIKPRLSLVGGLKVDSFSTEDITAIWAASPHAPISYMSNEGEAAIVWGEAIARDSSERIDASSLRNLWKNSPDRILSPFDGFHAFAIYHPHLGLTVAADILGLFPIYYYTYGDVALVGSSPELFRHHPLFKQVFNPAGLVGILLTNGLFDGQTLWQGVRRLGAGQMLVWQPDNDPKEVKQYQISDIECGESYSNLPFDEQIDILAQSINQTLARHAPVGTRYSLFLSGGLDSRMLGGVLSSQGADMVALTIGKRNDIEMECAVAVARTLGIEQHTTVIPFEQYPLYADLVVNWEHLANGCDGIVGLGWGACSHLGHLAPRVISGYALDRLIGGTFSNYFSAANLSFETFFSKLVNRNGFSAEVLERLLKRDVFGDLVRETLLNIQAVYESYSDEEFLRSRWFELYHRIRFLIGSIFGWQLCFGAWPVVLLLDWQFLKTIAAMPVETLAKRQAQNRLICTQFRELAQLPLDRNDFNTEPLVIGTRRGQRVIRNLYKMQGKWRELQQKLGYDRRHYYQMFDLNNPGWRAIRQQAQTNRQQVEHLFHQNVLNELLPPPDTRVQYKVDAINEPSSIKALLGFLLWSKDHL